MVPVLDWVLFAAAALLAIVALALALSIRRRLIVAEERYHALVNVLRNEIRVTSDGSVGVGRRLQQVESRLNVAVEKQHEIENRDPDALAYNQATKLMEMGADVDHLVSTCGIARPEAELMALLHREIKASPSLEDHR